MKKLLLFIISSLIFTLSLHAQDLRQSIIVETDIFIVEYNEVYEQPIWLEYTVQCPDGNASRSGLDFWEPEGIHTSDDDDYKNNVWDKGHLAPAAAFNCDRETLKKTFSYLNSALQHQSLNRGVWNRLESFERSLANFYEVNVRIEVIFPNQPDVLETGGHIPMAFRKIISWGDREAVFLFPNKDTKGTDWIDYLVKE